MNHLQRFKESLQGRVHDRSQLRERFIEVRQESLRLSEALEVEDYVVQPHAEVSPIKWHLGHTTWFFEELILRRFEQKYCRVDEHFPLLFNSYYKAAGEHWAQSKRGILSRPTVAQVLSYRHDVEQAVQAFLEDASADTDIDFLMEVGIHHEQQHQELMCMDIKAILACQPQHTAIVVNSTTGLSSDSVSWHKLDEGLYEVGHEDATFAYDNEGPAHKTYLYPCAVRTSCVTNQEYMEFIKSGGYQEPRWWLSEGWDWLQEHKVVHPLYWRKQDEGWQEFAAHGWQHLDANAPVSHVSYFEADAFANWTGFRLPTEQEAEVALKMIRPTQESDSLWTWTRSHYSPYPGYRTFPGMIGEYNGKFMCNQFVLKGGCAATPRGHYRHSYRNFYQPHQRWMFSGIRLAKDL